MMCVVGLQHLQQAQSVGMAGGLLVLTKDQKQSAEGQPRRGDRGLGLYRFHECLGV